MQPVKQKFAEYAVASADVVQAVRMALRDAADELRRGAAQGDALEDVALRLGLRDLRDQGIETVGRFALTDWMTVPMSMLPGPGGVRDVPDPDCVVAHLPTDRTPTRADYERAWELCVRRARP